MYLDRMEVENYLNKMIKIYENIYEIGLKSDNQIADSSKYKGKIEALIEFKKYLESDFFTATEYIDYSIDEE